MYAIKIENLNFGYTKDQNILKDINLSIPYNKFICILGHNGSGKSTLSKLLLGLAFADSGTIHICNIKMNPGNSIQILKRLGLVFQNPDNQFIGITPEDDIAFGLENRKVPPQIIKVIVKEIASFFNLNDILYTESTLLSGGQKQKVAIASVLANNPEIIIFDESTAMLDAKNKKEIQQIMQDLVKKEGKTVISITHDMEELLVADEIIILKGGRVVKHDSASEVLKDVKLLKECRLKPPFVVELSEQLSSGLIATNEDELIDHISSKIK